MSLPLFVSGEPVLFLAANERAWKDQIKATGLVGLKRPLLCFVVSSLTRGGNVFDLDNLCKPVLDVVAGRAATVWAQLSVGDHPGVWMDECEPPLEDPVDCVLEIQNPRKRSIKGQGMPELEGTAVLGSLDQDLGVHLTFRDPEVNIADFGFEGPIKPLIDGLVPILGTTKPGSSQHACDHRIKDLRIDYDWSLAAAVLIRAWLLDPTRV